MRPYISNYALRRLSIPDFSGGVNYRDNVSQVLDNQLTDCRNVWYKNGVLQTRPGIRCAENPKTFETDFLPYSVTAHRNVYAKRENTRVFDGVLHQLVAFQYTDRIVLRYYSAIDKFIPVATITDVPPDFFTCNIFQYNTDIYCFCSGYYDWKEIPFYIFKITEDEDKKFTVKRITQDDAYIPTVMLNAIPIEDTDESQDALVQRGATLFEGYNLLGNKYKIIYSTAEKYEDPEDAAEASKDFMRYMLLFNVNSFVGDRVIAEITQKNGSVYRHEVYITGEAISTETEDRGDGIFLNVQGKKIYFTNPDGSVATVYRSDFIRNNMVVTAPCSTSRENYEKILNMTKCEWFGGGSQGIYGGLHLFLGGNTKESEKALVCWSDFNKPLYFSENGYAYVGDTSQRVTTFGKQNDSLFIFKEHELYATQYSSSSSVIDADTVQQFAVVDVTSAEVTFPMTQVHGFIGCDCPDTVQLCRNRLAWAHSEGKIYTLVSASQWNERSIYEVSGMVEPVLREFNVEALQKAISADWEGHYVLSVGGKLILMDYNSYGYSHVYSYSKEDDAQAHVPFWVWDGLNYKQHTYYDSVSGVGSMYTKETPVELQSIFVCGNELYTVGKVTAYVNGVDNWSIYELFKFEDGEDLVPNISVIGGVTTQTEITRTTNNKKVSAMAQTKLFDFGGATLQKAVPKVDISFGNNNGNAITVTTITDRGESSEEVRIAFEEADKRNPQFFKNVAVRNRHKINSRVGYRMESEGNIFIDAMTVYFKVLGGSR